MRRAPRPGGWAGWGFVARGLGRHASASVPVLFLALFSIGMPAGVLVAGDYLAEALGGRPTRLLGALAILSVALATNLRGVRTGARVRNVVTWGLLAVGLLLIGLTFPQAIRHYDAVRPELASPWPVLSGSSIVETCRDGRSGAVGALLIAVTCLFAGFPWLLVEALITASSVFVLLYILSIVSYVRSETSASKRIGAAALLVFLVSTLGGAGPRVLYPVVALALGCGASYLRERRG